MRARGDSIVRPRWDGWHHVSCFGAALVLLAIGHVSGVAGEAVGDFTRIRSPERDGVNCLYIQLRLLGYSGTYENVIAAMPGGVDQASLAELAEAARRLGFHLVPVKQTVVELSSDRRSPMVILFEEASPGEGRFHVLLAFSQKMEKVLLIHGEFITRIEMPIDRFRRGWTGFALMPQSVSPWPKRVLGMIAGAVLAWSATWLARRIIRIPRSAEK